MIPSLVSKVTNTRLPLDFLVEDPDRKSKGGRRGDDQDGSIPRCDRSPQECLARPLEDGGGGKGADDGEDGGGVGGEGEEDPRHEDERDDHHRLDPAEVFRLVDGGAADGAETGK